MSVDAHIRSEVLERTKELAQAERIDLKLQEVCDRLADLDRQIDQHKRSLFRHSTDGDTFPPSGKESVKTPEMLRAHDLLRTPLAGRLRMVCHNKQSICLLI